jgi:hypothetical protein
MVQKKNSACSDDDTKHGKKANDKKVNDNIDIRFFKRY